jgi:hypothetical protein
MLDLNSMKIKQLISLIFTLFLFGNISFGQNRLNSRLFYLKPPLFNSQTQTKEIDLSDFSIKVSELIDNRSKYYGETVYKKKKVEQLDEFFQYPTMIEIQRKIKSDFSFLRVPDKADFKSKVIVITPIIEVFYPDVRGFIWAKSFAKVRLIMIASLNDKELINKKYESFYITNGTDKEFEGTMMMTIEQAANVTIGMTLRKSLDEFYIDLNNEIKNNR